MILNNKFLSLLGMARKANMIALGYDMALDSIHSGRARVVFTAEDLSEKTARGLIFAAEECDTKIIATTFSIFDFTNAVGTKTGIISINNAGFAKKLCELYEKECRNAD